MATPHRTTDGRRPRGLAAVALALALSACGGGGGTPQTHKVSGSITPGATAQGTTITLGSATAMADANSAFAFTGVADGTYTATPTKAGVTFAPASRSVTVSGADVTGVDITAEGTTGSVTLSGAVHPAGGQIVDSDTADVNAPSAPNDTPATAQTVPSAVTVGGHASFANDQLDAFHGSFAAGEVVNLDIADPAKGDLDLYLYTAADLSTPVATSMGTGGSETLSIPGTGTLTVTGVSADAPWLTVGAGVVDGSGLGAYTASADRSGLAVGRYSASIKFSLQRAADVVIPVSVQVGSMQTVGDAGYLYVLLVDSTLKTVAQVRGPSGGGALAYQFTDVPPGPYLIVAGTDSDNDDLVCDAGEACGAWPTLGAPTPLTVGNANVTGLDFVAGFPVSLGSTAASAPRAPGGYRRLEQRKSVAGP